MVHNTDLVRRYKITDYYRTIKTKYFELTIIIPYAIEKLPGDYMYWARIRCPFCSVHKGEITYHYHGHGFDGKIFGAGNGYRNPHCKTDAVVELELPDGTIVSNKDVYYIEQLKQVTSQLKSIKESTEW